MCNKWATLVHMKQVMQSQPRVLVATSEVAAALGVSRQTVHRLVERGELTPVARVAVTRHGSFVFDPADVEALAEARAKAGAK